MPDQFLHPENYQIKYPNENPDLQKIKDEKIVFSIAAFNSDIALLRQRVDYLCEGFKQIKIFLYVLDSTNESTLEEAHKWKKQNKNLYLVQPIDLKGKPRTLRIGGIRNELLKHIKIHIEDINTKIIVMDSDHLGTMSKCGLIDAIERINTQPQIYAICSSGSNTIMTGLTFLYDTFAYYNKYNKAGFKSKMHATLPQYDQLISGFSGASIYRYIDLKDIEYNLKPEECEHVSLHKTLKEIYDKKFKKPCFMEMSKKFHICIGLQKSNL